MIKNIMSVDLEDYYCDLPFSSWGKYESRIVQTTKILLDLFQKHGVKATFFTLGYVAEKYPGIIEEIKSKGHEIASHSYSHIDLRKVTKEKFEEDLIKSLDVLRKASGDKILGFRAPFFSISKQNLWVFEILKKHLRYDSSIFPVRTPLYGIPEAPRNIYTLSEKNPFENNAQSNFVEIPLATLRMPFVGNIPVAGGFHLRFLPYTMLKMGINQLNKKGFTAMCYIHPKDLDPNMPHIEGYGWHYYWGLENALRKFETLLKNFTFSSVIETVIEKTN